MSGDALLLKNEQLLKELRERDPRLADRDAQIVDRDAKIEKLASDLRTLEAQFWRLLGGRIGHDFLADGQGVLFGESQADSEAPAEHATEAPDGETADDKIKRRHRPASRVKNLDTCGLPTEERRHELAPDERFCSTTGLPLVATDTKIFEEIEYRPGALVLIKHTRVVYGLGPEHAEDRFVKPRIAPLPARPLDGVAGSASLLDWPPAPHLTFERIDCDSATNRLDLLIDSTPRMSCGCTRAPSRTPWGPHLHCPPREHENDPSRFEPALQAAFPLDGTS